MNFPLTEIIKSTTTNKVNYKKAGLGSLSIHPRAILRKLGCFSTDRAAKITRTSYAVEYQANPDVLQSPIVFQEQYCPNPSGLDDALIVGVLRRNSTGAEGFIGFHRPRLKKLFSLLDHSPNNDLKLIRFPSTQLGFGASIQNESVILGGSIHEKSVEEFQEAYDASYAF